MIDPRKYFDHNATTPLCAAAREAWLEMADRHWENPSSLYREAGEARRHLEDLREEVAEAMQVDEAERIVFTSGATEANNAMMRHWSRRPGKIALSAVEHPSVREAAAEYFGRDRILEIPVDPQTGVIDLELVERCARAEGLAGVSVMAANNETGTLQPFERVAAICREREIPFHSDAVQWIGRMPWPGDTVMGACAASAHKFGGPKGVGFLVLDQDFEESDFVGLRGGPQENGRRGGTEDLPGIAAMVAALRAAIGERGGDSRERDRFEERLRTSGEYRIVGAAGPRLPHTSMFVVPHSKNLKWLTRLSQRGFGVSTGSACSAGRGNPSTVMLAMGLDFEAMGRVLRVSGGAAHGPEDWAALAEAIFEVERELRSSP